MSVPAEAYDFGQQLQATRDRLYPSTQYGLPERTPAVVQAGGQGQAPEPVKFSETLLAASAKKGAPLSMDEIEAIRAQYLNDKLIPALWSEKGMTQGKAEALQGVFANKSQRTIDEYLASIKGVAGAPEAANGSSFNLGRAVRGLADTAATTATSAIGGVASGVLSLADLGVRGVEKLGGGEGNQTWIGDLANQTDRATQAVDRYLVSDETLKTRDKFYSMMSDPNVSADAVVEYVANNSSALTGVLGNTIGMLTPAAATRIPKLAKIIKGLEEGGMLARAAAKSAPVALAGAPVVGQAAGDFQRQIEATPLDELRKQTPQNEELYQLIKATGLSDTAVEATFKSKLAARGLPAILATSAAANLALPGLNPLAVEKQIAGNVLRAGSRLGRVARSAGAELTEEGLASGIETAGQNVATEQATGKSTPTGQNVGKNVLLGAGLGAVMGGAVAIPGGNNNATGTAEIKDTDIITPEQLAAAFAATSGPNANPAPAAQAAASSVAPAPVAGKGIDTAVMPTALTQATRMAQTTAANAKSAAGKGVRAAADANDLISRATVAASAVPNFEAMNAEQQLQVIETIAGEFAKKASKVKNADVAAALAAMRTKLTTPEVVPQVNEQPTPAGMFTEQEKEDILNPPGSGPQPKVAQTDVTPIEPAPPVESSAPQPQEQTQDTAKRAKAWENWFNLLDKPLSEEAKAQPLVVATKAAFDQGLIKTPQELEAFVQAGAKLPAATDVPTAPQKRGLRKPAIPKAPKAAATPPEAAAAAATPVPATEAAPPAAAAPAAAETPTAATAKLPDDLAKAKPTYNYGLRGFKLQFDDDIDKAAYIVSGKGKSKAHGKYVAWLAANGISEEHANTLGQRLRDVIKAKAAAANPEVTTLVASYTRGVPPVQKEAHKKAPTPPQKRGLKTPKTSAPTPNPVVGAQASQSPSAPQNLSRETAQAAVARILGDSIDEADAAELAEAMELARDGENKPLEQLLKDLSGLTQEDKKAIREASRSLTPAERGEATTPTEENEEPYLNETYGEQSARIVHNLKNMSASEAITWLSRNGPNPAYRAIAKLVAQRVKDFERVGAKFKLSILNTSPMRGLAGVSKLKASSNLSDIEVAIELYDEFQPSGTIGTSFETALHEFIHAVSSVVQHTYTGSRASDSLFKALGITNTSRATKAAQDVHALYNAMKRNPQFQLLLSNSPLARGSNFMANEREFLAWGLTNGEAQKILKQIQVGTKQTAWSKFVTAIRNMLGLNERYDTALDKLLSHSEELMSASLDEWLAAAQMRPTNTPADAQDYSLSNNAPTLIDEQRQEKRPPVSISAMQRLGEVAANSVYGLERAEQEVRKTGAAVPPDLSPMYAGRKYQSDIPQIVNVDIDEVVNPIAKFIKANWKKFADSPEAFRKNSDLFFQTWHQLTERLPDIWLQTVPLNNGQNMARDILIDEAHAGNITPEDFYKKLNALVSANASATFEEWANTNGYDLAAKRKTLADLKRKGYDENTLAEYNAMFAPVRERIQQHMLASGRIAPNDPWVRARNWQWYFPLKGLGNVNEDVADSDYGTFKGYAKAFRSRALEVMEGRKSLAGSVAEQLVSDLSHEGTKRAEASFKETLFAFVQEHLHLLGNTDITIISGTPKQGFTKTILKRDPDTRKLVPVEVPVPAAAVFKEPTNGFVYHNGDTHFRVRFDTSSPVAAQLDRGLKGFNNVQSFKHPLFKGLNIATNLMARGYTTYSPEWQFFVGFARDLNYIPSMVAAQEFDSPLKAGKFFRGYAARVLKNTANIANLKQTISELRGDHSALRKQAGDNKFLQDLEAYRNAGGSTEFSQSLNTEAAYDILFGKAKETGIKGRGLQTYRNINEWTSNWAQLLENKGRVAAWKTLVDDLGYDPQHAAAVVKGVMDFGQSGEWGRKINAWIAFYRVGATGADAMRRAFTTPTGKADWPKLAKWSGFYAALGASAYMMMAAGLGDDEDGKQRIKKYDIHTLTQKLIIPTGKDTVVSYPIGLGLPQLLIAPGIIATAYLNGNITEKEARDELYDVYNRNAPVQPAGWQEGTGLQGFITSWATGALIPTAARPLQETTYNVNAFDTAIHSQWKDKTRFRSEQGMQATPQEWKDMARELREMTGGLVDMFPEDIRHLAKGYLGQPMSDVSRWTMDFANKENQGLDSQAVRTSLRIGAQDEDFYYSREMNKTLDTLYNTQRRYKQAKENPTELTRFTSNPDNLQRLSALKALEKAKKAYYSDITKIRNSNASVEGRRYARKRADSALRQAVQSAQRVIELTD
jgi:hypothetical protein